MIRPAKTVAAIHDLSGLGRCALTVVLPVLSAMGAQACPVPTAVLSAHTAFSGIAVRDLTEFLPAYLAHWQTLGLHFDAVYAGYLADPRQVEIIKGFLETQESALKVIDPAMGDDGRLYAGMSAQMPARWRELCARADVATPNMTEYALLTGEAYSLAPRSAAQAARMLGALLDMGAQSAVITSLPLERGPANVYMRRSDGKLGVCPFTRLDAHYPGTGDLFASVLTGALLQGDDLENAVLRATAFTRRAVARTMRLPTPVNFGVDLEPLLPLLWGGAAPEESDG